MLHTGVLCLRIKKAQQLINEMRKAHQIPESSINEPKDFTDVRNQVSQTILDYLDEPLRSAICSNHFNNENPVLNFPRPLHPL